MRIKTNSLFCAVVIALATMAPVWAANPRPADQQQASLYKRLGGYDALAAVTDDFLGRLSSDPQLSRFFKGQSTDSLKRIRTHIVDFLCMATGGPCAYIGRDMKTAHTGLGITEEDWNAMAKDLNATFDKFNVPAKERQDVLTAVAGLKGDIVGR
ncbi:MAG TPA: group 1 truncated hemoglobin [Terriglobales bacterium]|nr:group 1 truncated hemoglobin [Terriglobales bacterium]